MSVSLSLRLIIDATDCPVKAEVYRLAARNGVPVVLVSARDIGAPFEPWLTKVIAGEGAVADTIAGEAATTDLVITDDAGLVGKLLAKQVKALTTRGQRWTPEGPLPQLSERIRGNNRSRFEAVLGDEIAERLKVR